MPSVQEDLLLPYLKVQLNRLLSASSVLTAEHGLTSLHLWLHKYEIPLLELPYKQSIVSMLLLFATATEGQRRVSTIWLTSVEMLEGSLVPPWYDLESDRTLLEVFTAV